MVYTAQNPPLVERARRHPRRRLDAEVQSAEPWSIPAGAITRALGFGVSQSGRFLRTYLCWVQPRRGQPPNCSTASSRTWRARDAAASITASRSRPARPPLPQLLLSTDIFPFTDASQRSRSGVTDGLLTHAGAPELLPKIFYTNSEYE